MILKTFLIFGDLSLDDSYKINSYKKMCVAYWPIRNCFELIFEHDDNPGQLARPNFDLKRHKFLYKKKFHENQYL